jgi:A/G-specific adenine glycosylase
MTNIQFIMTNNKLKNKHWSLHHWSFLNYNQSMKQDERISAFCDTLWQWYKQHKRVLPWRDLTIDDNNQRAYLIWISEVMLQQTQVSRVIVMYKIFIQKFPDLKTLAKASNSEIIKAWEGMGYNSRALRLRDGAQDIITRFHGIFPSEYEELLSINGIGPYTAAAICNFAFNKATPCIDTNIRRVIHRAFYGPEKQDGTYLHKDKELLPLIKKIIQKAIINDENPKHDAKNWHAALMDYGSAIQTKRNPKTEQCPLAKQSICKSGTMWLSKNIPPSKRGAIKKKISSEPGRDIDGTFVPNRIIRGRVVQQLREFDNGRTLEQLGEAVCSDWNPQHEEWLQAIIEKLIKNTMIVEKSNKYSLEK